MSKLRLLACATLVLISGSAGAQTEYYTQRNLWVYKGESPTVNWAVESLVPVNSLVRIDRERRRSLEVTVVNSGVQFSIVWDDDYTNAASLEEYKALMLGTQPVDLSQFSEDAQAAIRAGEVREGMTKEEVLVARGFPPSHVTLSLDSNQWRFWQNRWNTIIAQFSDGRVETIID